MERVKGNFGFGCMRLPMNAGKVDYEETSAMVDAFLEAGFNYFDTAHGYLGGQSEQAVKQCLTSRYPRDRYVLTDKLTVGYFHSREDIRPLLDAELQACGVDWFDCLLMHAQGSENFKAFRACQAYEAALELMAEGKFRHFGISFHDTPEVLEEILTAYPQIEVVQIQLNYLDWEDPAVQSRRVYEVCRKYKKPVLVMEPVKGGSLANLPEEAQAVLDQLHGGGPASYALRFAAGLDGVMMVLSGMSSLSQMQENLACMKDFMPLNKEELEAVHKVTDLFHARNLIPCTACRYCTAGCPKGILIPDLFAVMNAKKLFRNWNSAYYYENVVTVRGGKVSDCIRCGACERACPQHLPIRDLLVDVAREFESGSAG